MDTFRDDSISAWRAGVRRPAYEQVLDLVRERAVDVVVIWHMSRLWRGRVERATGIDIFKNAGVRLAVVQSGDIDFSTAMGRGTVAMLGEMDTMESDIKSERVRAQKAQARAMGKKLGGRTQWGLESRPDGMLNPVPELEDLILSLYQRYVAGTGVPTLGDELNGMGPGYYPNNVPWRTSGLQGWLDRMSAFAVRPDKDAPGGYRAATDIVPVRGCDEALRAAYLEERDRRRRRRRRETSGPRGRVAQWTLSGLAVCGDCGSRLVATSLQEGRRSRLQCTRQKVSGTCPGGGTSVNRLWLERSVGLALYGEGWSEALLDVLTGSTDKDTASDSEDVAPERFDSLIADLEERIALAAKVRAEQLSRLLKSSVPAETMEEILAGADRDVEALETARREAVKERDRAQAVRVALDALATSTGGDADVARTSMFESLEAALGHEFGPADSDEDVDVARWNRVLGTVIARVTVDRESVVMVPTSRAAARGAETITLKRQRRGRTSPAGVAETAKAAS